MKPLKHSSLVLKITALIVGAVAVAFCLAWLMLKGGMSGWISLPLVLILFLVVGFLFSRKVIAPLVEMRDAAEAMAQGNYGVRVNSTSNDEIGQLATSFNVMGGELEHADQMRRDLIANVSHELRTPVAALQALVENMADGVVEPTSANLESILNQTHRLSDLIAFLLDLSRMEAGAASLEISTFDFRDFIDDTLEPLEIADAGHDHGVKVNVPRGIMIEADQDRLRQLFTNIISNAMKHSTDGSNILIEGHQDLNTGNIVANVINFGSQIPPEDRSDIFRRYVKGVGKPGTSSGGTGLGLSIARWAAQLHGGTVNVVDDERGTDFQIELPKYHISDDEEKMGKERTFATSNTNTAAPQNNRR
ncbi:MAG: HAMP domain-containing histidine kinase [Bifidobacteriaceae bacterium]|jgi:signal transduction histidine kinase|nr:HAMP domain-containing histidine kinase [Bifidobacteriaceae bacterium]MCI1978245.1 HAMP domain-containing histidine kinase [Bifidobacteriaceae bacterium]